jgi:glycosyltransferase involved in cell wall biosynthesis
MTQVCMLATSFPRYPGDFAGTFVYHMAQGLVQQGIPVSVVAPASPSSPRYEIMEGIKVHRFSYWWPYRHQAVAYRDGIPANLRRPATWFQLPTFMLGFLFAALRVAAGHDLIHVHWLPLVGIGIILRSLFKTPIVATALGSDVRLMPPVFTQWLSSQADAVLAPTCDQEAALSRLGVSSLYPIPLPIDDTSFNPDVDATAAQQELGLSLGQPVVTFVARFDPIKDPLTLIEAIPQVLAQHKEVTFLVVGDGPLRTEVQAKAAELGLDSRVRLTGMRSDINQILRLSTLFLALSPAENVWSTTIAEAMAVRVPCIITAAGRSSEFFADRVNCYLVPPQNPRTLAEAILHLLDDAELRQKIAVGGSKLLRAHDRTLARATARLRSVYDIVLRR